MNFVLYTLKAAYKEFEERSGQIASPKGAKTELVISATGRKLGPFRISDIQKECPGVSLDLVRSILKNLRSSGKVKCLGRGQNAEWEKSKRTVKLSPLSFGRYEVERNETSRCDNFGIS